MANNDAVGAGGMLCSTPVKRCVRVITPRSSKIAARFSGGSVDRRGLEVLGEGSVLILRLEILNCHRLIPGVIV